MATIVARRVGRNAYTATQKRLSALSWFLCSRCGAVLPEGDQDEALLRKLFQLSRFGLCAGGGPLLGGSRVER